MESDVRFGMNSDDPEARSVAHEEFGEETKKDGADLLVLVVGGSGSFSHGTRRRGRGRKGDVGLHHVRVEYLMASRDIGQKAEGLMERRGLDGLNHFLILAAFSLLSLCLCLSVSTNDLT